MTVTGELLKRNQVHAEHHPRRASSMVPSLQTVLITCCDHRVDPAHVLGLRLDEAVVIRNEGGRVTPDVLRTLTTLATVALVENLDLDIEIIVMHHTDCGTSRLARPEHAALAAQIFGVSEDELDAKHLTDPVAAVRADLHLLRNTPLIPTDMRLAGLVYDVETGTVDRVEEK
ncbi:carbonic anhydrase [Kitasatospora atroaurantiaca]|uniref:carbonic anhydrase n=1 Tax=Kitasatospora atroaurantiaca TaxID=285545 RepID=A0A561EKV9_9ACTN|nr:carbonic anhydrase [Kitasatospora atroaurantiaca]TWE16256.1 carbonic anhydrase [Kitasatospora atroaurantiaca]